MAVRKPSARKRKGKPVAPSVILGRVDPEINTPGYTGLGGPPPKPRKGLSGIARIMEAETEAVASDPFRGREQRARETPRLHDPPWLAQARRAYRALGEAFDVVDAERRYGNVMSEDDIAFIRRDREQVAPLLKSFLRWYAGSTAETIEVRSLRDVLARTDEAEEAVLFLSFWHRTASRKLQDPEGRALFARYLAMREKRRDGHPGRALRGDEGKAKALARLLTHLTGREVTEAVAKKR